MTGERKVIIAPSILSADFSRLGEEVRAVEAAGADWMHLDVMDGHFVPNLTIGPGIVGAVDRVTNLPLDVHLMIDNPADFIEEFAKAGADYLVVHQEGQPHLHRLVGRIRELGVKAGVALNPSTPLSTLADILPDIDLLLIMSVNPGFGGQSFIPAALAKLRAARELIDRVNPAVLLEIDGGVKADNAAAVREAGVDAIVSGSGIYGHKDYRAMIAGLKGEER
ncbi:MAG: ribulose-phosphate 3-epimerase [Candidatus Methylomirabilia bacterium]